MILHVKCLEQCLVHIWIPLSIFEDWLELDITCFIPEYFLTQFDGHISLWPSLISCFGLPCMFLEYSPHCFSYLNSNYLGGCVSSLLSYPFLTIKAKTWSLNSQNSQRLQTFLVQTQKIALWYPQTFYITALSKNVTQ